MARHFLTTTDINKEEFHTLVDTALTFKRNPIIASLPLENRYIALIFEKPSTRTRVSFEVAVKQLGGSSIVLHSHELQLSRGESPEDTSRVLSRYIDGIVIRTFSHETLQRFADYSSVPVINGLSDSYHPCQALTDFVTIREHRRTFAGLKFVFMGDGSSNVCHSLLMAAVYTGAEITVACPKELSPSKEIFAFVQNAGGRINVEHDAKRACAGADILYTDVWVSMGQENEKDKRMALLMPYQLNETVQSVARKDHLVMHCLPAHKGEEISEASFNSVNSVIFDQAENRLHTQKALLQFLFRS